MAETVAAAPPAVELERNYLLQNYARLPIVLTKGKGSHVWDAEGNRYLDLISGIGVNALGHAHPRIVKVIRDQAARLIHSSNLYYHEFQGPLAQRLCEASGLQRAFFANSGTEAMELAMKMIHSHGRRTSPEKYEIVALENSFHGRSMGALSLTGQPKYRAPFEPVVPGVKFVPAGDVAALEAAVGPNTAGIVLEWIQGEGGVCPVEPGFTARAKQLAEEHDALLVFDEIQCGLGRTGRWFAYQLADPPLLPDVMVTAKPLAAGLPLGAVLMNERAAASIGPGMHGTTFGGGALACRVALEAMAIVEELLPEIERLGEHFRQELRNLTLKHHMIREVRGYGLMIGIELDRPGRQIVLDAMAAGALINCTHDSVIRLLPPYIITEAEIAKAIKILDKVFKKAAGPAA
ncbi:MAG TPA: aspartate aminotransferase family protein [Bryobacteraceae bacterium]|nr:aspartate aminotransferase family protein [Bryobacteraceae bacterium]